MKISNYKIPLLILLLGLLSHPTLGHTRISLEKEDPGVGVYQKPPHGTRYANGTAERQFDQKVLDYINEMRRSPKAFYKKYLEDYIQKKKSRFTSSYTRSLKKDMEQSPALALFETSPTLEKTARLQLDYLSPYKGRMLSHDQGNIGFAERMKRSGLHCLAENLYAAEDPEAIEVVLDLLIDQNVSSLGHRKNLLSPQFTKIGIVSGTPKGGRTLVIMDFGCAH